MGNLVEIGPTEMGKAWEIIRTLPYDTLIDAAIHGYHGKILADSAKNPKVCQINVSFFTYFAGDANCEVAKEIVKNIPIGTVVVASNKNWENLIKKIHQNHYQEFKRFSFTHEGIDINELDKLIAKLPKKYTIKRIDRTLAEKIIKEPWCDGLVSNFKDIDEFLAKGLGFCVLDGEKIISGASSFIYYNGGYEVEIDTHKDYQRQHLATSVGAKFIKHCLSNNFTPHWDAENEHSMKIAEKFGFKIDREYNSIEII